MDYRDVTHTDFKTKRHTNPLAPIYMVRDESKEKVIAIGDVKGRHPQVLPPAR